MRFTAGVLFEFIMRKVKDLEIKENPNLPENVFEGENFRITFEEGGLLIEVSDEDDITADGVYGEFSKKTRLIPYENTAAELLAVRQRPKDKPFAFVFIEVETGDDDIDGGMQLLYTEKFAAAAQKYGMTVKNADLADKVYAKKEKPKKTFRLYEGKLYKPVLSICITAVLFAAAALTVVLTKGNLWLLYVSGAVFWLGAFYGCFALASPISLKFYGDYLTVTKNVSRVLIDKPSVREISVLNGKRGPVAFAICTIAQGVALPFSEKAFSFLKSEIPDAEIIEESYD